jgi:hypothetical protein
MRTLQSACGPAGICDNCGRRCTTLDQAGIPCYHCHAGTFRPRGEWTWTTCPTCDGIGALCPDCHQTGCRIEWIPRRPGDPSAT